jgi:hypothetical protein
MVVRLIVGDIDHRKGVSRSDARLGLSALHSAITHASLCNNRDGDNGDLDLADAPPDKDRDAEEKSVAVDSQGDRMDVA